MTVEVEVDDDGFITQAAPIVRKFVGQRFSALLDWMEKQGGLLRHDYDHDPEQRQDARRAGH
jgi:hypothetical protein